MALFEINHETCRGQSLHGLCCVFEYLADRDTIYRDIIQVHYHWQSAVTSLSLKDAFHYILEMCRGLRKAHRHPNPPILSLVCYKGRVVGGFVFEWDIVEPSLEINHAYILTLE